MPGDMSAIATTFSIVVLDGPYWCSAEMQASISLCRWRMRSAYRMMFGQAGTLAERIEEVSQAFSANQHVRQIVEFARAKSSRGLCQPRAQNDD